jgi:hypothetical protein
MTKNAAPELWLPPGTERASTNGGSSHYRKAPPPALGDSFEGARPDWFLGPMYGQSSPVLMFDLSKLTWLDYAEMRWHPQVNASLSLMTFMLHQMDWTIESEDTKLAETVEENLRLIWTQLVRGISTAYWAGYAPCVLEWENTTDGKNIFISKVKDLHPGEANVHWEYVESTYKPPPEYAKKIKPKVRVFAGMDKLGLDYPIPPEHTFWYPVLREQGDYTGRKLLKAAFAPWFFSHLIHLYSNRYFERFGEPVPVGRYPANDEFTVPGIDGENDTRMTSKQVVVDAMRHLRSGVSVTLPSDRDDSASGAREYEYDIEYLESQMRGADFERYLDRLDEEISLAIFTPLLLMRAGDRGSLNLGVQHTKTWLWSLNALGADLKEYIDPYICQRIAAVNHAAGVNAPRVEWKPRSLGKDNDETIRALASALITQGHAKPNLEEIGTALGMTMEQITELNPLQKLQQQQKEASANGQDERDRSGRADRGSREADGPSNTVGGATPRTVR